MYGIVNQAIAELINAKFGAEKWETIKAKCGIDELYFISDQSYEDNITYELVGAAADVLNLPETTILQAFGEWWVLHTAQKKYGDLLKSGGKNFIEFINNLPHFHGRIMLLYPKLSPPEFKIEQLSEEEIILHYYSARDGLTYFVIGLISGIGILYDTNVRITHVKTEKTTHWHDIISISIEK